MVFIVYAFNLGSKSLSLVSEPNHPLKRDAPKAARCLAAALDRKRDMRMKQLDIGVVREILMSMPDVQESTIHGHPSFKIGGKLFVCPAIHKSVEENSLVVKLPSSERDRLLAEHPHQYYLPSHYASNSVILARLSEIDRKSLRSLLERAWLLQDQDRRTARSKAVPTEPTSKKSSTSRSTRSRVKCALR